MGSLRRAARRPGPRGAAAVGWPVLPFAGTCVAALAVLPLVDAVRWALAIVGVAVVAGGLVVQGILRRERASGAQRRRLLDVMRDGVLIADARGRVLEVNRALCTLTGYGAADMLGRTVPMPFWPPDDHVELLAAHQQAIADGGGEFEAGFRHRDGTVLTVLIAVAQAVETDAADAAMIIVTVKDITEQRHLRNSQREIAARSAAMLATMSDGYALARDDVLVDVNPALCRLTGFSREQLIGTGRPRPFWPPECVLQLNAAGERIDAGEHGTIEMTLMRADGTRFLAEATTAPVHDADGPAALLITVRDITRRREAEDALSARSAELAALAEVTRAVAHAGPAEARQTICECAVQATDATTATIWEVDADDVLHNTCMLGARAPTFAVGPAATSRGSRRVLSTGLPLFVGDASCSSAVDPRMRAITGCAAVHFQPIHADGRAIGVLALSWARPRGPLSETAAHLVGLLANEAAIAIERAASHAELERLASTDALTGLANRRTLEERSRRDIAAARRSGLPLSLAIIDLDHFKAYNDTFGHPAGDGLLRTISQRWGGQLRETDVLARWGGEEFCLLLPSCAPHDAQAMINELRTRMPDGQTFSAGVATWRPGLELEDLVRQADQALYTAKHDGRNRTVQAGVAGLAPTELLTR